MAPATRGKRAAQSPPAEAEPAPAKQPRKTNARANARAKAKVEPDDEDQLDNPEPEAKKPAARKGRGKANVQAEPEDDEQDDAAVEAKSAPKKGKAKAAAPKTDPAEPDDQKPAPKKGRGKAKVKDEPVEDEQVDSKEPANNEEKSAPPEIKEAQLAKAGTSNIPLDEGCYLTQYHVYVDSDNLIYDASLNQTNASGNNNKFYRVQVRQIVRACRRPTILTPQSSCSKAEATTRHGLVGEELARVVRTRPSAMAVSTTLSRTSRRSSKTNQA